MMFVNLSEFKLGEIILLVIILKVGLCKGWFENCDHNIDLRKYNSSLRIYFNSPYYPNRYRPGSSCRYLIIAPVDHEINISCTFSIDKNHSGCASDFLYISSDGDSNFKGGEYFCGEGNIERRSLFNRLAVAYTSSSNKFSGKFSCVVVTSPQSCDCGRNVEARITEGVEAKVNEYPFMAAIVKKPSNKIFCGGVIISHQYILSAAHCFYSNNDSSTFNVIVGDHDLRTGSETPYSRVYRISEVKIHKEYAPNKGEYNDIALLRTSTPIEWSRGVGPACLPFLYSFAKFNGMSTNIVGWGTTQFAGAPSPVLLKATVNITSNAQCKQEYPNLSNSQICTYSPPKDSCQYDSGGPLIIRFNRLFVVGLISYGTACGTNSSSVNTRITSYLKWIKANTRENFCEKS